MSHLLRLRQFSSFLSIYQMAPQCPELEKSYPFSATRIISELSDKLSALPLALIRFSVKFSSPSVAHGLSKGPN